MKALQIVSDVVGYARSKLVRKKPKSATYVHHPARYYTDGGFLSGLPPFSLRIADMMMADPQVSFGLMVRNAALLTSEIEVEADDPLVKAWVELQWKRIWSRSSHILMRTKRYGYLPSEVVYRAERGRKWDGYSGFSHLRDIHPQDARVLTQDGSPVGFRLKRLHGAAIDDRVLSPHALWSSYRPEWSSHYGRALLQGAHVPWHTKWMDSGANDLMRLRMMKDAWNGDLFEVAPNGVVVVDGVEYPLDEVCRQAAEARAAGGVMTLPLLYDDQGNKQVIYTPPADTGIPSALFEWSGNLDIEIWKGLGVVPEVIEAATTGSGYSGRSLPAMIFFSSVQEEMDGIVSDVDRDILRPTTMLNFGREPDYTIKAKRLIETFTDDVSGTAIAGGAVGGGNGTPPKPLELPNTTETVTQFGADSIDPDADKIVALGTSESVKRIRAAKADVISIVKKKA